MLHSTAEKGFTFVPAGKKFQSSFLDQILQFLHAADVADASCRSRSALKRAMKTSWICHSCPCNWHLCLSLAALRPPCCLLPIDNFGREVQALACNLCCGMPQWLGDSIAADQPTCSAQTLHILAKWVACLCTRRKMLIEPCWRYGSCAAPPQISALQFSCKWL